MNKQPLCPPNRLARFAPFPWRAFVALAVILAIFFAFAYLSAK
jgi:hypothetical protein